MNGLDLNQIDEKKQRLIMQAVESGDQATFNKVLLGKESPGVLDYVFPTGKFTQAQELFQGLVARNIENRLGEQRKMSALQQQQPPLEEIAGLYGGKLPFQPVAAQMGAPIVPTPQEAQMLQARGAEFSPLQSPLAQNQPLGINPLQFNPAAKSTPLQANLVQQALQGQVVTPNQTFVPPALAKPQGPAFSPMAVQPGQPILTPQGFITAPGQAQPKQRDTEIMEVIGADGKPARVVIDKQTGQIVKEGLPGAPPKQPLVTVQNQQEGAEAAGVGKGFSELFNDVQKAGLAANTKIARLDRLESLMQGVQTGKLTPAITEIQAIGQSLGMQVDPTLPAKQAMDALSNQVALELRNPAGGAGMPGQLSDKDREFLVSMTPNLSKTPEGNKLIIQTSRKLAQREQELAKLARDYRKRKGKMDEGFYDEVQAFSNKHPLFTKEQKALTTLLTGVAPFSDDDKERRYQAWKSKQK